MLNKIDNEAWETIRFSLAIALLAVVILYGKASTSEVLAFASGALIPLSRFFGGNENENHKSTKHRLAAG